MRTAALPTIDWTTIRVVSFDVDGTLYSAARMRWHLARMIATETLFGRGAMARADIALLRQRQRSVDAERTRGGALADSLRTFCESEQIAAADRRWVLQAIASTGPRRGVATLLARLTRNGVACVALSDYAAGEKLTRLGLREYFSALYEGVRFGVVKPHPASFVAAARDHGIAPSALLHIGDRADADGAGAAAAGCRSIILGRGVASVAALLRSVPVERGVAS